VDFTPLQGSIIIELSPHIAFTLIDRILGGKGSSMEKVRGFTEIELVIIERIIIQMLNLMRDPWENVIEIKPRLEKIETNSQFAQIIPPNEMIALISFNTKIGEAESIINLCIPFQVVESIVNKLSTKFWFSTKELAFSEENKGVIQHQIETTRIPIIGILGTANVTVKDVMDMQIGDVITLDTHVSDDIPVYVGGLNKFKCRAGVKNNRLALKITTVLKEEED
jgi:flagellar motor switch protein FliM